MLKSILTAIATPVWFSIKSGHWKSALKRKAVNAKSDAIPWYTYPAIDYLETLDFRKLNVLEIGGGQSTHWWEKRCESIVTLESDPQWAKEISSNSDTAKIINILRQNKAQNVADVFQYLESGQRKYEVIILDAMERAEIVKFLPNYLSEEGILICDNSEGYGIYEGLCGFNFFRIDFWGYVPGVFKKQCTSIFFGPKCRLINQDRPIKK